MWTITLYIRGHFKLQTASKVMTLFCNEGATTKSKRLFATSKDREVSEIIKNDLVLVLYTNLSAAKHETGKKWGALMNPMYTIKILIM